MATKHSCTETRRVLKFWILWIMGFLPLMLAITSSVSDHDLEIMNLLKKLNKPYVKSSKSPYGDIIDCVLFHLQPAFDNPLLKNHTIQMQPNSYPEWYSSNHTSNKKLIAQIWHTNGRCPKGTVPIRRTTKEDILRAKSIQSFGKKDPGSFPNPDSPPAGQTNDNAHEYATRKVRGGQYLGSKAHIGIWNPRTEDGEFSLAQTWLSAGAGADLNTIEAGWQVYPALYRDNRTHLFGYWTRDGYQDTGCYNQICDGFVQYSNAISLGSVLSPISILGVVQHMISLHIYKHPISDDWWLELGGERIGKWPSHLFTHLRDSSATRVDWGGEVTNKAVNGTHTSTKMGSGRFSREEFIQSAYFTNLQIRDETYFLSTPVGLQTYVTNFRCYDLRSGSSELYGELFSYGGPGRNAECT